MKHIRIIKAYMIAVYAFLFVFTAKERKVAIQMMQWHKGQKRMEGTPYWIHPIRVAIKAKSYAKRNDLISVNDNKLISNDVLIVPSSLLHDVIEDCNVSVKDLTLSLMMCGYSKFCSEIISKTVVSLTNKFTYKSHPKMSRSDRKEFEFIRLSSANRTVQTIKVLDRIDNLNTIKFFQDSKFILLYAKESMKLFRRLRLAEKTCCFDLFHLSYKIIKKHEK